MAGVAPRGKGIGLVGGDDVHRWHREVGALPEPVYHLVQLRGFLRTYFLGLVHAEDNFVAEPVAGEIHHQRYDKRDHEALGAGDGIPGLTPEGSGSDDPESDPLYDEAVQFVLESRRASISAVQRKLRIGYNRAARLIETMEAAGLVSGMGTNGSREVLAGGHE